jgi:transmembrane sensor
MNMQIYEEASEWLIKHRTESLDPAERARFDQWLRQSPLHVRAYLEMNSVWDDIQTVDAIEGLSSEALLSRAKSVGNIVPLPTKDDSPRLHAPPKHRSSVAQRKFPWKIGIGIAATVALFAVAAIYSTRDTYATGVGEQRSITLSDGSIVELNARSRIRVRFEAAERGVDMIEGQALFHVAKNPARPFIVHAAGTQVRAVGTQFDVLQNGASTVVTVVEGRVSVLPRNVDLPGAKTLGIDAAAGGSSTAPQSAVLLAAGEQVTVSSGAVSKAKSVNATNATAWTQHNLIFDSASLEDVAAEFNRYNARRLVVDDPQISNFHISGVFSSSDPALLIRFLRAQPELNVEESERQIHVSKR